MGTRLIHLAIEHVKEPSFDPVTKALKWEPVLQHVIENDMKDDAKFHKIGQLQFSDAMVRRFASLKGVHPSLQITLFSQAFAATKI